MMFDINKDSVWDVISGGDHGRFESDISVVKLFAVKIADSFKEIYEYSHQFELVDTLKYSHVCFTRESSLMP